MKICLVSAPIITSYQADRDGVRKLRNIGLYPPLGILVLAAALERDGHTVSVVHSDLDYMETAERGDGTAFEPHLVSRILATQADVVGFSSICSSYPLTVRLARSIKALSPSITIVLGGPQASVVDIETMEAFPWFDIILRGEADESLPALISTLAQGGDVTQIAGSTYRLHGDIHRAPDAPLLGDLDRVPSPAYHLYQASDQIERFPLELGRGCPYACEFCSTNLFFSKRFRLRSPANVFREMVAINARYNVTDFELVHDMFTVDRTRVVAFCDYLREKESVFTWSCSARTDRMDEELLKLMHAAGCRGVFFGIETGSQRLQIIIRKHLDLQHARTITEAADRLEINATASLITGFPDETEEDYWDTIRFFLDMLKFESVDPQLHILSPLPGTPIEKRFKGRLKIGEGLSDIAFNGNVPNEDDAALVREFPNIFTAYLGVPTTLNRETTIEFRDFLMNSRWQLRYVLALLHLNGFDVLHFFRDWREQCSTGYQSWSQPVRNAKFLTAARRQVKELPIGVQPWFISVIDLVQSINNELARSSEDHPAGGESDSATGINIHDEYIPKLSGGVVLHEFQGDFRLLRECLRHGRNPPALPVNPTLDPLIIRIHESGSVVIESIPKPTRALLKECITSRPVAEIISEGMKREEFAHVPIEKRAAYLRLGLHMLSAQQIVTIRSPKHVQTERDTDLVLVSTENQVA